MTMDRITESRRTASALCLQIAPGRSLAAPAARDVHTRLRGSWTTCCATRADAGCSQQDVQDIAYAIVALADELALSKPGRVRQYWLTTRCSSSYFKENAPARLLHRLQDHAQGPPPHEVLRAYYLCLIFGFQGRYRMRGGELELLQLIEQLQQDWRRAKFDTETLSPSGERPAEWREPPAEPAAAGISGGARRASRCSSTGGCGSGLSERLRRQDDRRPPPDSSTPSRRPSPDGAARSLKYFSPRWRFSRHSGRSSSALQLPFWIAMPSPSGFIVLALVALRRGAPDQAAAAARETSSRRCSRRPTSRPPTPGPTCRPRSRRCRPSSPRRWRRSRPPSWAGAAARRALRAALVHDHRPAGRGQDAPRCATRASSSRTCRAAAAACKRRGRHAQLRLVAHQRGRHPRHRRPLHHRGRRPGRVAGVPRHAQAAPPAEAASTASWWRSASASSSTRDEEERRRRSAQRMRERIDEVMARLKMVVPVYVLFTKCDLHRRLRRDLRRSAQEERGQIWGFTVPAGADSGEPRRAASSERFDELLERARAARARAPGPGAPARDAREDLRSSRSSSRRCATTSARFVSALFAENVYQDTPIMRGVYFTSGTQEGRPIDRVMNAMAEAFGIRPRAAAGRKPSSRRKSYFLRDVFAKVIFPDQRPRRCRAARKTGASGRCSTPTRAARCSWRC